MDKEKLHVGILVNVENLAAWAIAIIEQLKRSDYAQVALIIKEEPVTGRGMTERLARSYLHFERRVYQTHPVPKSGSILDGIPVITSSDPNLAAQHLDLILHLGAQPAASHLRRAARFGIWEMYDGERVVHTDDIPGFSEVLHRKPVTTCAVLVQDGKTARVLQRGTIATDPISVSRNCESFFWKAADLLAKAIRRLYQEGAFPPVDIPWTGPHPPNGSRPNVLGLMRLAASQVGRFVGNKIRARLFFDQWVLMTARGAGDIPSSWEAFSPLLPPADRFWADPFILERDGCYYIFFEELLYSTNRGRIACMVMDGAGNVVENRPVLEKPYHLSYPFVFEHDGTLYMIPETGANRRIDVYQCMLFPFEWEYCMTLMDDVEAKDATLLEFEGRWWLFATVRENKRGSTWDQISVFWSESPLTTEWTPHPLNPVVTDVRTARPAGRIFPYHGSLLRPSQDCSHRYGFALNFNRIVKLNETEYEEVCEARFEPPEGKRILATHTYNQVGDMTVIDASILRRK